MSKKQEYQRKQQKAALKRKRKAAGSTPPKNKQGNPRSIIRKARNYPILECWINPDWDHQETSGFARILLARQQTEHTVIFGSYLVDMFCLGLKDTFCNANVSTGVYRRELVRGLYSDRKPKQCPVDLAHQIIYQAIDYAAQFGFKPQRDFKYSNYVLEQRGTLPERHTLSFGRDGKPFFVSGPYDNVSAIIAKLEKHAGPGNYDYLIEVDAPDEEFLALFSDGEEDEEGDD